MIRPVLTFALTAALAACGAQEPAAPAEVPAATPQAPAPDAARPGYVGRWAATPALCADGAWTFRHDGLNTAGEVSCRFDGVAALDDGYEIAATCTAEAPPQSHRLNLSLSPDGRTMSVRGGPFDDPPPLSRCP
ncbi:MAG: hypothetical protein U1A07_14020 [Phenylobacterium sp.]|nr:hypothetical protein [Phenylobacterium sp.]MDZ4053189.1 hypothetical protein [Phenylobacterium sp.]MDZ4319935.1 hypothetical protein [Phenylobacterium sp.]